MAVSKERDWLNVNSAEIAGVPGQPLCISKADTQEILRLSRGGVKCFRRPGNRRAPAKTLTNARKPLNRGLFGRGRAA
jgi:hypothetical protein